MVDHIEVLKDGASSIYGADAIGGVINIITKKSATGMTFDSSIGVSGHDDGLRYSLGATVAAGSDRGNVMIGVSWNHHSKSRKPDRSRNWAIEACKGNPIAEGGSAWRYQLDLLQNENPVVGGPNDGRDQVWANGVQYFTDEPIVATLAPNLTFVPASNEVELSRLARRRYGLESTCWARSITKEISFTSHYDITDNFRFIASGFFTERTSEQKLRPEQDAAARKATPSRSSVNGVTGLPRFCRCLTSRRATPPATTSRRS